jgi:3-hydroxyisobutyrate dehydrogenase-like beta-hydroxyacid dehydrogenase
MTPPLRPGLLGLGIIGQRVAAALRAKGFTPAVWNRTARPDEPGWVESPQAMALSCDVLQFFVTDGPALLEQLKTMLPALGPGKIVVNSSTISPADTHAADAMVTKTGASFLDAPFTGSREAAAAGQLVYYVAGDPAVLEKVRPMLEASSKDILFTGSMGSATVLKIATNMVSATIVGILAEAMGITAAQGIPLPLFQAALERNAAASGVSKLKVPSMIAGDFSPHFSLKNMLKDASFGLELASGSGLQLPILGIVAEAMAVMASNGHADEDYSVMACNYLPRTHES